MGIGGLREGQWYRTVLRKLQRTGFGLTPFYVAFIRQYSAYLLSTNDAHDPSETPAETHAELVGTGKFRLLSPKGICL